MLLATATGDTVSFSVRGAEHWLGLYTTAIYKTVHIASSCSSCRRRSEGAAEIVAVA